MKRLITLFLVTVGLLVFSTSAAALNIQFFNAGGFTDATVEASHMFQAIPDGHNVNVFGGAPVTDRNGNIVGEDTPLSLSDSSRSFPMIDPNTGQVVINPQTGQPMMVDFSGLAESQWLAATQSSTTDILMIPELEQGNLVTGQSTDGDIEGYNLTLPTPQNDAGGFGVTQTVLDSIASFVQGGGTLVSAGGSNNLDLLNSVFGYNMQAKETEKVSVRTIDSLGAPLATNTANELPAGNAVIEVDANTLPSGANNYYATEDGDVSVMSMNVGQGQLIYLGFDWFEPDNEFNTFVGNVTDPPAPVTAENVDFEAVRIGTSAQATLTVSNTGQDSVTGDVSSASGRFSGPQPNEQFNLASGESKDYTFEYAPVDRSSDSQLVSIDDSSGNSQDIELSGRGVSGEFSSSVAPGGTVDVGGDNSAVLTLSNINPDADLGDLTDITILEVIISGAAQDAFSTNFDSLTATQKRLAGANGVAINPLDLIINFDPLASSFTSATLTIKTDLNSELGTLATGAFEGTGIFTYQLTAGNPIPEPNTLVLLTIVCLGFFGIRLRKRRA